LTAHATTPIAFVVDRVLEVTATDGGLGGLAFAEAAVSAPVREELRRHRGSKASAMGGSL